MTTTHQSLKRGLDIIETVAQMEGPPTLAAIARKTSLNRSTTHHILKALVEFGYLVHAPESHTYSLSSRLFRITRQTWTTEQLTEIAKPFLEDLGQKTGEGASLAVLRQGEVVIVAKREPEGPLRVVQEIGSTRPIYCTAVGKVLAAWLDGKELAGILERTEFEKKTAKTIVTPAAFKRELARVRESGVAIDNEEHIKGIRCMAGPVRDHYGDVRAALCVVGPRDHLPPRRMKEVRRELLTVAVELSSRLGYHPGVNGAEGS